MIWVLLVAAVCSAAPPAPRVVVGLRAPVRTLDPFAPATIDQFRLTGLVFEPLAKVNPRTQTLEPWLARAWTRAGQRLRVTLRDGVQFHDRRAVTAHDVVETFARFRDPANKAATWAPLFEGVASARAIGRRVVEFSADRWTFERVVNLLTHLRVQPAHRPATDLIGTGPYLKPTEGLHFTRFTEWWHRPRPALDLQFKVVYEEAIAELMIGRGELDFYPASRASRFARPAGTGDGFWIDLNVRRAPFDDARVREAILALWDRADLNQKVFGGERRLALDSFDPDQPGYPPGRPVPFDPPRAARLLEQAGWQKTGATYRRDGRAFEFEILIADASQARWAEILSTALARAGIVMRPRRRALDGEWWRLLREGHFDAAAGGGPPAITINADAWRSTGGYNVHGLSDPKLDEWLARQDVEFDSARRRSNARHMIEIIRRRVVQLPGLIAPHALYLTTPRLKLDVRRPEDPTAWVVE